MTCKNTEGGFLFDVEAEITSKVEHQLAASEKGRHFVRCYNDGYATRIVTITSKCGGPLLNFSTSTDAVLASQSVVPPRLKAAPWESPHVEINCGTPGPHGGLPSREHVHVEVTSTNTAGRFPGALPLIQLALNLHQ